MKEKPYYYSLNDVLAKQRRVNFIIGGRELGKTYSVKKHILKKLLKNETDKMIYFVRYQSEKKVLRDLFDDVLAEPQFEGVTYKITTGADSSIYINGKHRGQIIATTEVASAKRVTGKNYFYLMFDEFLAPKGKTYARGEVENVLTIMHTVLRGKGDRVNDAQTFFLANSTKLFNPYFDELGFKPDPTKTFNLYEDSLIEICNPDDYAERVYEAGDIHDFFKRHSSYSEMAFGNTFEDNTDVLIRSRTKYDKPLYTFRIKGKDLGIWYDEKFTEILFSFKTDPNTLHRFAIETDQQDDSTAYKAWYSSNLLEMLQTARDRNAIWFEDPAVKSTAIELLKKLRIY